MIAVNILWNETPTNTGANSSIGYEVAKLFANTSAVYRVFVCGRTTEKSKQAVASIQAQLPPGETYALELDIINQFSIANAVKEVSSHFDHLDVLINNAGIQPTSSGLPSQLRECLETNAIAQSAVTEAFKPLLVKSANPRILFVSSSVGSITLRCDPTNKSYHGSAIAYRTSKAALNMLAACYAKELKDKFGAKVWAVEPGLVATNLTRNPDALRARGALEPDTSARTVLGIVEGKRDEDVGKLVYKDGLWPW